MRRSVVLLGVTLTLSLVGEALALSEPNVIPSTRQVRPPQTFLITVNDCKSGSNSSVGAYTATIEYDITYPDGVQKYSYSANPDESDGITEIVQEAAQGVPPGLYKYDFRCIHQWAGPPSGEGTYWSETIHIDVLKAAELTAAEKRKCKRKDTAAARRRCRQKQAAD